MKYMVVLLTVMALMWGAGTAAAATPNQRIAKLERIARTQQAQIATLTAQNAQLNRDLGALRQNVQLQRDASVCTFAQFGDVMGSTWNAANVFGQWTGYGNLFPTWQRIDDRGACAAAGLSRSSPLHLLARRT
jgi:outer membrane murein-binding lipoprotein Lpp